MKKRIFASLLAAAVMMGVMPAAMAAENENAETVERILHTPQMITDGKVTYSFKNTWFNNTVSPFTRKFDGIFDGDTFLGGDGSFELSKPDNVVEARLDFGEGRKEAVSKIKYYPRKGYENRLNGVFEGSNDGTTWKTIHDIGVGNVTEYKWYTAETPNYRFADGGKYDNQGLQDAEKFNIDQSIWNKADINEAFRYIRYTGYWRESIGNDVDEIEYYAQKPVRQVTLNPTQNGSAAIQFTYYGDSYSSMDPAGPVMDLSKYAQDDYLTVTAVPDAGYYLKGLAVRKTDGTLVDTQMTSETAYTFRMPDQDVTIQTDFAQGTPPALENGAYQISNAGQLEWFANQVNTTASQKLNAVLLNDIDLENKPWVPIGDCNEVNKGIKGFHGSFDGQGHIIKNLTLCVDPMQRYESKMEYTGLFGYINEKAMVKNLHLRNVTVPAFTTSNENYPGVGGMAGRVSGSIYNCSVENMNAQNITVAKSSLSGVGGMAGCAQGNFYNSYVKDITISGNTTYSGGFAGQIGWTTNTSHVDNCCAYNVNVSSSDGRAAALAIFGDPTSSNCFYDKDAVVSGNPAGANKGAAAVTAEAFSSGTVKDSLNAVAAGNSEYGEWYQGAAGPVLRQSEEVVQPDIQPELVGSMARESDSYEYNAEMVFDKGFVASYDGELNGKQLGMVLSQNGKTADMTFNSDVIVEGGATVHFGFIIEHIPETLKGKISAQPYAK